MFYKKPFKELDCGNCYITNDRSLEKEADGILIGPIYHCQNSNFICAFKIVLSDSTGFEYKYPRRYDDKPQKTTPDGSRG